MKFSHCFLLLLLCGCSSAPFEITERLRLENPAALIIDSRPLASATLQWAPQPIDDFIISQNADGLKGRNVYQKIAVGRLISRRVEDYIGTLSKLDPDSPNRVIVTIKDAELNYKYGWSNLIYAKLLINAEITAGNQSRKKIYYRQVTNRPELTTEEMLAEVFDQIAIEIGRDILTSS